jgi:hypothetical protein
MFSVLGSVQYVRVRIRSIQYWHAMCGGTKSPESRLAPGFWRATVKQVFDPTHPIFTGMTASKKGWTVNNIEATSNLWSSPKWLQLLQACDIVKLDWLKSMYPQNNYLIWGRFVQFEAKKLRPRDDLLNFQQELGRTFSQFFLGNCEIDAHSFISQYCCYVLPICRDGTEKWSQQEP